MAQIRKKVLTHAQEIRQRTISELLKLVTSSFGLIAALAWNEVIKEIVNNYIRPLFGDSSGLISLLIYALAVTLIAVVVAYNLTRLLKK